MNEREIFAQALEITTTQQRAAFLSQACGEDGRLLEKIGQLLAEHDKLGSFLEQPLEAAAWGEPCAAPDRLCSEFAVLYRAGQAPRIADFLERIDHEQRAGLLKDLIVLEVGLRSERDEPPNVEALLAEYEPLADSTGTDRETLRETIERALAWARQRRALTGTATAAWSRRPPRQPLVTAPQIDGFEIESVLGKGGMGVVFRAVQTSLGRPVALKMIVDGAAPNEESLQRFAREAKAVAELNDPHFVQIYEFGECAGKPYMALEYVEGGSLEEFRQAQPQPIAFMAQLVEVLARAMHRAHEKGLVHRDLKPHNVLLTADGTPKIADFGLVKRQHADESQMTQEGVAVGTASYMAPEQTYGAPDVGPAADIYALGGILYCLLTGRPPFLGATRADTVLAVRTSEPVPPSRLRPGVPRDLEVICLACLEKEPRKRYATAVALADDLRRYQEGRPITRRPVGAAERAWRWSKRNPLGAAVAALVAAIAVISSVMSWRLVVANQRLQAETEARLLARDNEEKARARVLVEQAVSNEQYNGVLWAYHNVLFTADSLLRNNRRDVLVRKRLIELMLEELDKVRALRETKGDSPDLQAYPERNSLFERNAAIGHQRLGDISFAIGRLPEALEQFNQGYEIVWNALQLEPDAPVHSRNLAVMCNKQAEALERLGQTLRAREKYQEALRSRVQWNDKLRARGIEHVPAQAAIAQSHVDLAAICRLLGDANRALDHLEQAKTWYDRLPADDLVEELCELERQLGKTYSQLGDFTAAERYLMRVKDARQAALDKGRTVNDLRLLCRARLELGDFYLAARQDLATAWSEYQAALAGYRGLPERHRETPASRAGVANVEYRLGTALLRAREAGITLAGVAEGDSPQAHFEACCRLRQELAAIDPDDMQAKLEWALALARRGQVKEAAEQAEFLRTKGENNPRLLSQAAAVFALSTQAEDPEERGRCRQRAYAVLDQLLQAGWKDAVTLRDDPDFDPLRAEPRFQQLLASLSPPPAAEARPAPTKPAEPAEKQPRRFASHPAGRRARGRLAAGTHFS